MALLVYDYIRALGAGSCVELVTPNCYPWGAEGPVAGVWNYANKDIYLRSALVGNFVLATAIVAPFFAPGKWAGLSATFVVLGLGFTQLEWLTSLF